MRTFKNTIIPKEYRGSAIAIGNFDGVHRGHQKVFRQAKRFAKKNKIIMSFLIEKKIDAIKTIKLGNLKKLKKNNQKILNSKNSSSKIVIIFFFGKYLTFKKSKTFRKHFRKKCAKKFSNSKKYFFCR